MSVQNVLDKFSELYDKAKTNSPFSINLFDSTNSNSVPLKTRIYNLICLGFKLSLAITIILLDSFIFCYIFNSFFSPYPTIHYPFNFYFSEKNDTFLVSEIYSPCFKKRKKRGYPNQCISNLRKTNYDIYIDMEIVNSNEVLSSKNYEIEIDLHTIDGEISKYKKLFFIDNGPIKNYLYKWDILPFKMLGYYKRDQKMKVIEDYYNENLDTITKIDIVLKTRNVNFYKSEIIFQPRVGFIRRFYLKFKYIILFVIFWVSFGWQIFLCIVLMILKYLINKFFKDE